MAQISTNHAAQGWQRQRLWTELPSVGAMADELAHVRRFLQARGLWEDYLADRPEAPEDA